MTPIVKGAFDKSKFTNAILVIPQDYADQGIFEVTGFTPAEIQDLAERNKVIYMPYITEISTIDDR